MKKLLLSLLVVLSLTAAASAFAADVPDLTGTWKGENSSVVLGNLSHGDTTTEPSFRTHSLVSMVIERQEDRRFSGKRISARNTENLLGFIDPDNKTLHMVDEDGYMTGTINDDGTIYLRYLEAGTSMIASYTTYAKVK